MLKRFLCVVSIIGFSLALAACSDDPQVTELSQEERAELERALSQEPSSGQTPASEAGSASESSREIEYESPPEGDLGISPVHPRVGSQVMVTAPGRADLSDVDVQWYLNGASLSGYGSATLSLAEAEIKKGDIIYATAFVDGADLATAEVTVENTMPRIVSSRMMPEALKPGDRIYIDVETEDADGDSVEVKYHWTVNDTPAGTKKAPGIVFKSGDTFEVRLVPFDGEEYGQEEVVIVEVGNIPPVIEGHYDYTFDGTTYTYQPRATDPDGDTLTYSLRSGPDAMEIDSITGEITWMVPEDFVGTADYVFVVEDGSGGSAEMEQSFRLTLEQ